MRGFVERTQLELFGSPPPGAAGPKRRRRAAPPLQPDPADGRWDFTRPWHASPHLARARRELDFVRDHFPELEGVTVRVGLTKRRGVLGLASLGATPMIWVRPRRLRRFAIAHELTHLLHARGLVPGGEKTCDLYTLARSAAYVDVAPFYLKVPLAFHEGGAERRVPPAAAQVLHALAREAVEGRTARSAIQRFERQVAESSAEAT
ncbi:MAG: hypothetical protein ABI960_07610 [Candidatus Eisenbacteria bacterium]